MKDINPGPGNSFPDQLTAFRDELYFTVRQGSTPPGIWKSDGTAEGTVLVTSTLSETTGAQLYDFTVLGDWLYFSRSALFIDSLWRTDGTAEGTVRVAPVHNDWPLVLTPLGDLLYFAASTAQGDREPWRSDGTSRGTYPLKDIHPQGSSNPAGFTPFNGSVYFSADDGVHGSELWKTDGTSVGTALVADLNPGADGSRPGQMVVYRDNLYFYAVSAEDVGLYRLDGDGRITLVQDLGVADPSVFYRPVVADGRLFFVREGGDGTLQLWRSNGTATGTYVAVDLARLGLRRVFDLTVVDDTLYFIGQPRGGGGNDLWRSRGTESDTEAVATFDTLQDDNPLLLYNIDGRLFLMAQESSDLVNCCLALWYTDGTAAGTVKIKQIGAADESAFGAPVAVLDDQAFFAADGPGLGRELWTVALPPRTQGPQPPDIYLPRVFHP